MPGDLNMTMFWSDGREGAAEIHWGVGSCSGQVGVRDNVGAWLGEAQIDFVVASEGDSSSASSATTTDGAPNLNASQAHAVDIVVPQARETRRLQSSAQLAITEARRQSDERGCHPGCSRSHHPQGNGRPGEIYAVGARRERCLWDWQTCMTNKVIIYVQHSRPEFIRCDHKQKYVQQYLNDNNCPPSPNLRIKNKRRFCVLSNIKIDITTASV